ncbi:hypothetical protein AAG906_015635 [Vitis piasezkii]
MIVMSATFGALSEAFLHSAVEFLLKFPDICDTLEAEHLKMKANFAALRDYSLELRLPGKVPSARMQSFVVSAMNEEEVKSFSDFYDFLELPTLGKLLDSRRHPLVISCELEKISPRLKITLNGAPAGHESAETPIGHESNGAVAGEGVNLDQAIANLSKVVGDFVGNQEATNAQLNQRIDRVESTLKKGWMECKMIYPKSLIISNTQFQGLQI